LESLKGWKEVPLRRIGMGHQILEGKNKNKGLLIISALKKFPGIDPNRFKFVCKIQ